MSKIDDPVFLRAFHDAFAKRRAADFRKQREDVDLHQEENIERPRLTSNHESDMKIYSTISSIARWPWRAAELASNARIA